MPILFFKLPNNPNKVNNGTINISAPPPINPANTIYIFFVADGSGGHACSTNFKEHNRNVAAWRKIEKTK